MKLADLMNEPWTLPPPDSIMGPVFADIFRVSGLDPPAATVLSGNSVVRSALVAEGRFLSILPESVFRFAGRDLAIKALPLNLRKPYKLAPVGIITLKNRTPTPVAQFFIECAREVAKPLATGKSISAPLLQAQET